MMLKTYSVRYNGLTSFIPPCFCWDVIDVESGRKHLVSALDLTRLQAANREQALTEEDFRLQEHLVRGELSASEPQAPNSETGVTLLISGLLDRGPAS